VLAHEFLQFGNRLNGELAWVVVSAGDVGWFCTTLHVCDFIELNAGGSAGSVVGERTP
jgi:hypothetical protein